MSLRPTLATSLLALSLAGMSALTSCAVHNDPASSGAAAAKTPVAAAPQPTSAAPVSASPVAATAAAAPTIPANLSPALLSLQQKTKAETQAVLDTTKTLVGIESGSRDLEGLKQLAALIAKRLEDQGMKVQTIPAKAPDFHPQLKGATVGSMVYGTKTGKGQRKVLLIAHMDTVYPRGMGAKQPFRIDGDRAYGLGIADDKGGVALILHAVKMLNEIGFDDYAQLGVLINGDEEIGSPGSGPTLVEKGGEYDAVFSFEGAGNKEDMVRLATSSIAIVEMTIKGKASHAGASPDAGRNALYELSHQILKSRNFGDPAKGLRINWTVAKAGEIRNVIPADANAIADVRALTNPDMDVLEKQLRESIKEKLIPDTQIELSFYRSRPAFVANNASVALARHARTVYAELGHTLDIRDRATGGGTDAAFAGLRPKGGVLESFGMRGFGAHSNDAEYVHIPWIAPRLYLATRMVMDAGRGAVTW